MGYKILGYIVWQAGKWYLRRRMRGVRTKIALGALGAAAVAGGVLVASRQSSEDD